MFTIEYFPKDHILEIQHLDFTDRLILWIQVQIYTHVDFSQNKDLIDFNKSLDREKDRREF